MALASVLSYLQSFIPGSRLVDGGDCLTMAQYMFGSNVGVTATTSIATAPTLKPGINSVDTVGTAGFFVKMPPAIAGSKVEVWNNAASNSLQLVGQQANQGGLAAGDQIVPSSSNTAAAVGTGVAQAAGVYAIYRCAVNGVWKQMISG
jgi:hypothetical protein